MPFQRLFFYTLYRLLVQKKLSSSLNLSAARLEREMYQMIQVSFAWQTWWRLPILMVGSGSKEKNTGLLHTGIFDQNFFISTIHPAPRMAGVSKEVKMHKKFEFVWLGVQPINLDLSLGFFAPVIYTGCRKIIFEMVLKLNVWIQYRNWKSESNWVQNFLCGLAIVHTRAIPTLKSQKYFLNL